MLKKSLIIATGITLTLFGIILYIGTLYGQYNPGDTSQYVPKNLGQGSRAFGYFFHEVGTTGTYIQYYGTQSVTGSGTAGRITGTSSALPHIEYAYAGGTPTFNFIGATLQNEGVAVKTGDYIAQTSGTGTDITLAGTSTFPSGVWGGSGMVGIGTTEPSSKCTIQTDNSGGLGGALQLRNNASAINTSGQLQFRTDGGAAQFDGIIEFLRTASAGAPTDIVFYNKTGGVLGETMRIKDSGNVGIGTTTPSNILTFPIASATDPIADAWAQHCLADYKDIGTETAEMIQLSANDKIKSVPVSSFTKKAVIADEEAEREPKQKYQDAIRESAKADLELYTAETGVAMNNDSYVNELLESMWETKPDRLTLIETNKQKLIAEKKALPKFQKQQYGIVAEDAPPEAQVLREDGSLQGVDPYPLIGILWANAQKQDERIAQLEMQIADLSARLLALEGR